MFFQSFKQEKALADSHLQHVSYEITEEPIHDEWHGRLTVDERNQLDQLHHDACVGLSSALQPLLDLKAKYPDLPKINNFLTVYYQQTGRIDEADALMRETYAKFPDYLFAKIAYGYWYLRQDDLAGFERLFDHQYDLKLLYPDRDVFHISEFIGLARVVGLYRSKKGEHQQIAYLLDCLKQLAVEPEIIGEFENLHLLALLATINNRHKKEEQIKAHRTERRTLQPPKPNRVPRGKR